MFCSILLPSRARPDRLQKTIESFYNTATNWEQVEILIRLDEDDAASLKWARETEGPWTKNTKVIVGHRMRGYASLNLMYSELAHIAKGGWLWIMNDDAVVEGQGWDVELSKVPIPGFIVQPEHDQNGGSTYSNHEGGPFPIVRQGSWVTDDHQNIGDPADVWLDRILRKEMGYKTAWLPGIKVNHQRDSSEELIAHRTI